MRCVNIDWLEVYCLESSNRYPCDANYFRTQGYFVVEREYGTRQYNQMFTIEDDKGNAWIEVRRDPPSGDSKFSGLQRESCHLRLVNRACYEDDCVQKLRDFLLKHDYNFQRIYRIDICYDFEKFDTGDLPAKFAKRYIETRYRKINQAKLCAYGRDTWSCFDWESLSWGNPKSMVSTKLYDKTKELISTGKKKTWIYWAWFCNGLIDNVVTQEKRQADGSFYVPDIWRVEFSIKSQARNWVVIESQEGKRVKTKAIPHKLSMFDNREKLWERFEELAFHYFHFKYLEYEDSKGGRKERALKRKDLCRDKKLFNFNTDRTFCKLEQLPKENKINRDDQMLKKRLVQYQTLHLDPRIRQACSIILENITRDDTKRYALDNTHTEITRLQMILSMKMDCPDKEIWEIAAEVDKLLKQDGCVW